MADHLNAPGPTTTSLASESVPDSSYLTSASSSSAETISPNSSVRSPGVRARPRLPAGPRTRKPTNLVSSKGVVHNGDHAHNSHLPDPPAWTADVQLTNPFSPTPVPLLSTPQPVNLPPPAPPASHQPDAFSSPTQQHPDDHNVTTSRPGTPTPIAAVSPFATGSASRKASHATVYSTTTIPLNLPAAQLSLTPEPLPYKYLTLDAAHWTLTSTELQSLVSSAIRESAKEQFIRLLPLSIVDVQIPEDFERIERSWDTAAARWRFEAHRRNMLLRALAASGADIDLLSQLSGTLGTLDSHAQDLLQAAAHRTQISAAQDTHRASALAVALRKLNASYARRTRDLDKARANIGALRSEVEEAWKVAEEQAAEVDKLKSEAASTAARLQDLPDTTSSLPADPATDDETTLEDDASDSVLPDGASIYLTSRAQVVDVTGTAVAAQARLTTMPSPQNPGRSPGQGSSSSTPRSAGPPPSAFAAPREPSSPATPPSDPPLPSSASQVSRVSAARRRSTRKSKASLRLPTSIASGVRSRSRSVLRGEGVSRKKTRSKSRSRKGKERDAAASMLPWLAADVSDSFLEMEGRPAGEEEAEADAEGEVEVEVEVEADVNGTANEDEVRDAEPQTVVVSSPPPTEAPDGTPSASTLGVEAPLSTPGPQQQSARRSSDSTPSTSSPAVLSVSSTPTFPTSSDSHLRSSAALADYLPDPASIFANATTTSLSTTIDTTTTTTTSALEIARRGHSLDLPSPSANAGKHHRHAAGAKIRRSISELLNFGSSGGRSRRRSLPFTFKGRNSSTRNPPVPVPVPGASTSNGSRSGVGSSPLQDSLVLNDAGSEDGWEDTRDEEGAAAAVA